MRLRRRSPPPADPAGLVSVAYQQRLAALERLRAAQAGVAASQARAERDRRSARSAIDRLEETARRALNDGDEAAAKVAAERCVPLDAAVAEAAAALEALAGSDAVLDAAVTLVQEQLDVLRRQQGRLAGTRVTDGALAAVQADLATLAAEFAPVIETLDDA